MKKKIIILTLIALSTSFATVTITGYIEVCRSCNSTDCGQIRAWSSETGGRVMATDCLSDNGYYSIEVPDSTTVWIEVVYTRVTTYDPDGAPVPCETQEFWKETDRIEVVVFSTDVTQDICCTEYGSEPSLPPCPCND